MNLILQAIKSLFRKLENSISVNVAALSKKITAAQNTADNAQTTADNAQTTADNAQIKCYSCKSNAESSGYGNRLYASAACPSQMKPGTAYLLEVGSEINYSSTIEFAMSSTGLYSRMLYDPTGNGITRMCEGRHLVVVDSTNMHIVFAGANG